MHLMTPELLISSSVPEKRPLSDFCSWVLDTPEFSNAPVHQVACNRTGVHEFILVACRVTLSVDGSVHTVWLRLERHPSEGGSGLMSKPNAAKDTIQVGKNPDMLTAGQKYAPKGYFVFYSEDRPSTALTLRHIAEMLLHFTQYSSNYSLFKTNCRWLCYALLECLKQCHQCYGGSWIGSPIQRCDNAVDTRTALEAKDLYLMERHPSCCLDPQRSTPNAPPLVAPKVNVAPSSINPEIKGNVHVNRVTRTTAVNDADADTIDSTSPPHPFTRSAPQPIHHGHSAYNHSQFHHTYEQSPAASFSVHQPSSGYDTPPWNTAPLSPPYSGCNLHDATHTEDYGNTRIRPQARPPNWQGSTFSPARASFPSSINPNVHHPCCPHQIAQQSRDSSYLPHVSCGHTSSPSSFNPQYQHLPGDFCTPQAPRGHFRRSPPGLSGIPEGSSSRSYVGSRGSWDTNRQFPPDNSTAHGSYPGRPNYPTAHVQLRPPSIPAQGPLGSARPQAFGYGPGPAGSGPSPYHNDHSRSPAVRSVASQHQSRSQPARGWTEEVWGNHVVEAPVRTESPAPLEDYV